jgi:hypothetical protein
MKMLGCPILQDEGSISVDGIVSEVGNMLSSFKVCDKVIKFLMRLY